jgi:hypothetical protein
MHGFINRMIHTEIMMYWPCFLCFKVEGLMMDIAAAEEEIGRWREAAEQEAAAGKAVMEEFQEEVF